MNIRAKLRLLTIISTVVVILMAVTLYITSQQYARAARENELANEINRDLLELGLVTTDYFLHNGPRAEQQWANKHERLVTLVGEAQFTTTADKASVERIRRSLDEMRVSFTDLAKLMHAASADPVRADEWKQQCIGQLGTRTQAIASEAARLARSSADYIQRIRQRRVVIFVLSVVIVAGYMMGTAIAFNRGIVRPLHRLHEGTEVIGTGRLDYKVGTPAHDEIGQLSRAFDEMTDRLQKITVSRDELVAEIARRKRIEEELELFFTVTVDLPCLANFEGYFTRLSPSWARTLGWTEAELLAKPFLDFVHPDDRESTLKAAADLNQGGKVVGFDNRYLCRDGSYRWLSWNSVSILDRKLIVAMARDVTDRKRMEEELAWSNRELEMFAYVASHDLQEPLRAVAGFVELLRQRYGGKLDAKADEYINFVVDGAKRMQGLINGLLEYSRVSTHGGAFEVVPAEAALAEALANLQLAVKESQAVVTQDPMPTVRGDPSQIARLFQNLIGNALKFRGDSPPRVHVGVTRLNDGWQFAVRDNGIGIAPEFFDRIFVIFQRLHTQKQYPGTGLGLAICKRIVERHGGRIWVESAPGRGTTFHFTLPAAQSGGTPS